MKSDPLFRFMYIVSGMTVGLAFGLCMIDRISVFKFCCSYITLAVTYIYETKVNKKQI